MPLAAIAPMMPSPRRKPLEPGISSPKPATAVSAPVASSSSITTPSVATIRCRASCRVSARDALQVEQRRQLLREAVDQVDLAIEVQHLGAERLALGLALRPDAPAASPRRAAARRPSTHPRLASPCRDRERARRGDAGAVAVQQPALGVLDRDRRAERRRQTPSPARARRAGARCICRSATAAIGHVTCRARRAPSASSASGSNGLVM